MKGMNVNIGCLILGLDYFYQLIGKIVMMLFVLCVKCCIFGFELFDLIDVLGNGMVCMWLYVVVVMVLMCWELCLMLICVVFIVDDVNVVVGLFYFDIEGWIGENGMVVLICVLVVNGSLV